MEIPLSKSFMDLGCTFGKTAMFTEENLKTRKKKEMEFLLVVQATAMLETFKMIKDTDLDLQNGLVEIIILVIGLMIR